MAADTLSLEGERRLHAVYNGMKDRCYNPKSESYRYYGARGISMCDTWLNNYEEFRDWAVESGYVEDAPRGACTIDRIDSNGNYEPNNCRWVDMKVQNGNRRGVVLTVAALLATSHQTLAAPSSRTCVTTSIPSLRTTT